MKMVVYSSHLLNNKGILNIFKNYIFEKKRRSPSTEKYEIFYLRLTYIFDYSIIDNTN